MVLQGLHAAGGMLRGYQQPFQPQAAKSQVKRILKALGFAFH
jgi:hypothetical protein